jgi:hypothetical protein
MNNAIAFVCVGVFMVYQWWRLERLAKLVEIYTEERGARANP